MTRPSVILVREWEQQMSSSGCCGRLEGDFLNVGGTPCFLERRREMEGAGALYRALRGEFGEAIELRVVDPRNWLSLLPILIRDFLRFDVTLRSGWATLTGMTVNAAVVNGRLLSRGPWPDLDQVVRAVAQGIPSSQGTGVPGTAVP